MFLYIQKTLFEFIIDYELLRRSLNVYILVQENKDLSKHYYL